MPPGNAFDMNLEKRLRNKSAVVVKTRLVHGSPGLMHRICTPRANTGQHHGLKGLAWRRFQYDIAPSWSPKILFCAVRWCVVGGMMVYGGEVVYERSGNPRVSKIACHLYCRIASQLCVRLRHQTKQQISASAMQTALAAAG